MAASLRILCTGDLHIGRRPSRLLSEEDARACSCASILGDIVDLAIRERIDIVLFSGDLVDRDNRFFEAVGPLERGLSKLASAGIDAVAVAGNHDFDVLPQLADQLAGGRFRLLGRGGRWERCTITRNGQNAVHVDGWSFPAEHVPQNPMREFASRDTGDGLPVIGMLHADLDNAQSKYAPVSRADFRGTGAAMWLLGHVHQFKVYPDGNGPTIMYPGSPQAMDPGEPGAHGPWLVELGGLGARVKPVHLPMSKVRYDVVPVDLTDIETNEGVRKCVLNTVRAHANQVAESCGPLQFASFRLRLIGRTGFHRELVRQGASVGEDLNLKIGGFNVRIEQTEITTRPAYPLEDLARGSDAPSVLARMLLALDGNSQSNLSDGAAQFEPLIEQITQELAAVHEANAYTAIASDPLLDSSTARAFLVKQGYALLDALFAQQEGAPA